MGAHAKQPTHISPVETASTAGMDLSYFTGFGLFTAASMDALVAGYNEGFREAPTPQPAHHAHCATP